MDDADLRAAYRRAREQKTQNPNSPSFQKSADQKEKPRGYDDYVGQDQGKAKNAFNGKDQNTQSSQVKAQTQKTTDAKQPQPELKPKNPTLLAHGYAEGQKSNAAKMQARLKAAKDNPAKVAGKDEKTL